MEKIFNHADERVRRAYETAAQAHRGQVDKAGVEYINHPLAVASLVGENISAIIVALLHDVAEDTSLTIADLKEKIPLTAKESQALELLNHDKKIPYLEYVAAIKANDLARAVKAADLKHNSDLSRIKNPSPKDFARVEKYHAALKILAVSGE
ncbi:MAG: bifunctional (p)ppGpp synthetase/guanosine-3',5'-bis(diphosphate) 3'-pyrophosphohydrolase [Selenomonadaceae bacterium]|nr:bifunctional (p)ppGpp synthetase/guanosine-3',5'-bis(diphosphate) 3'-pyrophosphohydrolase [Selenomonadaceae bacterium]